VASLSARSVCRCACRALARGAARRIIGAVLGGQADAAPMALRVLLVDHRDPDEDEDLVRRALEQGGYAVVCRRVETPAAMRAALEAQTWDVVIADSQLPDFSARQALDLLGERGLDLPLLVVSGSVGEEAAVELMRAGARDVVTTANLQRLVPAIRRELAEAERRREHRRADHALRESEAQYRRLVESSPQPIAVHSGGVLVYANLAAARLMGASEPAVLIGRPVLDFVHPADRPLVIERIRRTQAEGRLAEAVEERFVRVDGRVINVETTALPTTFEGQPATQVVVRDITERKRAETTLRFLARASAELSASLDYRTTLRSLAQLAVPELGDWCVVDLLVGSDGALDRVAVAAADPSASGAAWAAERHYAPAPAGAQHGVARVSRTASTEVVNDGLPPGVLETLARDPEHTQLLRHIAPQAYVCAPLLSHGRLLGTLSLLSGEPGRYDTESVALIEELARRAALAIEHARLFEQARAELADRIRAEAELRASRDQLDAVLGGMADGAAVQDAGGHFIYANEAAARLAGFDSATAYLQATGAELSRRLEVVDADGRPFDYARLPARRALAGEEAPEMLVQFRRRDTGEVRWSISRARLVRSADGQPLVISIFQDQTERIRAERRLAFLAEAGARLGTSLDEGETRSALVEVAVQTVADCAMIYLPSADDDDATAAVVHRSAAAHRDPQGLALLHELDRRYPPRPGLQSLVGRMLHTGTSAFLRELTDASLVDAAEDAEHLRLLRALQLSTVAYVPLQARGERLGVLALFTTLASSRRLGQDELTIAEEVGRRAALAIENARLYAQAREAIRARDEFLSIASHELRNPVAAIVGTAQLLERVRRRGELELTRLDRHVATIERTAAHLASLVNDLLDVSRLQQGRLPLRVREVDLAELVRTVAGRHQARDGQPPLWLRLGADPCLIAADADRLEQVVTNLLDNAVKYSPPDAPIELTLTGDEAGVLLVLRDRGIGLPAGTSERIFEPFGRAANATERNIPGLGLGLYICRQIAERHGGRLWAESAGEDRGTSLHLWLPRQAAEPPLEAEL